MCFCGCDSTTRGKPHLLPLQLLSSQQQSLEDGIVIDSEALDGADQRFQRSTADLFASHKLGVCDQHFEIAKVLRKNKSRKCLHVHTNKGFLTLWWRSWAGQCVFPRLRPSFQSLGPFLAQISCRWRYSSLPRALCCFARREYASADIVFGDWPSFYRTRDGGLVSEIGTKISWMKWVLTHLSIFSVWAFCPFLCLV